MKRAFDQIPDEDRPREKLLRQGPAALSDQELLAVLLGMGTVGMDVMTLAGKLARVIDEKGLDVGTDDLLEFDGIGPAKSAVILAAIEFARRRIKPEGTRIPLARRPLNPQGPSPSLSPLAGSRGEGGTPAHRRCAARQARDTRTPRGAGG